MPQVNFTIKGLVACYRKPANSEEWSFVFPYDDEHNAFLTYTEGGAPVHNSPPISLANKKVTITAERSTAPNQYATDNFHSYVLDITASYLHNEGLEKKQVNKKTTIKHAGLDAKVNTDRFVVAFQFEDFESPPTVHVVDHPVADEITGKINVPDGGKVVIDIQGGPKIEVAAGESFQIDNFCGNCHRDFLKYHKPFKNKRKPQKYCDVLAINKAYIDKRTEEPIMPFGEPPAFCDAVQIDDDDLSGLD